ncbi:polyketide cyclase [Mycobacterium bourgelatii]|uniref:Activator of HSP90 ATPase n=1 Tax=Mycobacterium bourgelatii TaxID=1273442 RepID=A0A7I9YKT6_MYCBU|nr:polyketide cyclase [Mycobacterium bourgelatii]MCV6976853.1 polyketide cyclase [Mycobacterium bourgelatii]GFG89228.1 activator of HSP90 ATPase [Mycobacterium bourgelatii]
MTEERLIATTTINAPANVIFDVLADPRAHAGIDGTGWVRESRDGQRLTGPGQIFRMAMYHDNHPDKHYEMANRVVAYDPPTTIAWEPGQEVSKGALGVDAGNAGDNGNDIVFGGWIWRYDLTPLEPSKTEVRLTYDWSAVPREGRFLDFPPFPSEHLDNSLSNLAALAARTATI